jgi:signal transduction histidine kinase
MWDIILDIIRTVAIGTILFHLLMVGKRQEIRYQEGWWYILAGFSLIFFGSVLDLTNNFTSLNKFIIIGDTKVESFLEKLFGYLFGFLLLAIGFWKWMPTIIALWETKKELKDSCNELELKVQERTIHIKELNEQLCEEITKRKQTEREMAELQEQLHQSQKMEAIGRLAGGIAHDFNNLLTIIKGYSQLSLIDLKEGNPLRGNIVEIQKASERAADLTRQLLAFSRRQVIEMKILDLNLLLMNLDKMLRRIIGEDIELVTTLVHDLGRVKADPGQIENVIINLASNARDAMPSGGKLTIETTNVELDETYARSHAGVKPGRYIMISVSDTGVGMTSEVKERIFEPFFTTKEKSKGTGLGVSTVYGIVKQSGGNIWVYSELGSGTTFKIYLPLVDEPLEEKGKGIVEKTLPLGNETLLVVEDEEEVRNLTVQILKKYGYKVLEASHGRDALN